jgi:hypothetical protein
MNLLFHKIKWIFYIFLKSIYTLDFHWSTSTIFNDFNSASESKDLKNEKKPQQNRERDEGRIISSLQQFRSGWRRR